MTRKHFEMVANDVRITLIGIREGRPNARKVVYALADNMCVTFGVVNRAFDRTRFMRACGFTEDDGR